MRPTLQPASTADAILRIRTQRLLWIRVGMRKTTVFVVRLTSRSTALMAGTCDEHDGQGG
eukprot:7864621-Alexandrium_andersonii.AAC.1